MIRCRYSLRCQLALLQSQGLSVSRVKHTCFPWSRGETRRGWIVWNFLFEPLQFTKKLQACAVNTRFYGQQAMQVISAVTSPMMTMMAIRWCIKLRWSLRFKRGSSRHAGDRKVDFGRECLLQWNFQIACNSQLASWASVLKEKCNARPRATEQNDGFEYHFECRQATNVSYMIVKLSEITMILYDLGVFFIATERFMDKLGASFSDRTTFAGTIG